MLPPLLLLLLLLPLLCVGGPLSLDTPPNETRLGFDDLLLVLVLVLVGTLMPVPVLGSLCFLCFLWDELLLLLLLLPLCLVQEREEWCRPILDG